MTSPERVLDVALAAVADGITNFLELVDHCVRTTELDDLAAEADEDPAEYLFFLLENTDLVRITDDDRVIRTDLLVDGLVLTHRLTESEIAGDLVTANPDLAAIDLDTRQLDVPGGTARIRFDFGDDPHLSEHGSLVGPPGWLTGFAPGDLVGFRRRGRGLVVEPVGEPADGADEIESIRRAFEVETGGRDDLGAEPDFILERVLIDNPELFRRPVPPVSELFAAAGIETAGGWAGRAGVAWKPPIVAGVDALRDRLRSTYGLDECCDESLDVVIAAWGALLTKEQVDVRSVNRALGHGSVVDAFSEFLDRLVGLESESIFDFATALSSSGRRDVAPALMLRSRHHEAKGDAPAAERDLEEAVRVAPRFGPALADLAWYLSDRGDAPRTVSLLRKAGVGEDDPMLAFHAGLGADIPAVGRNEPCPCGSGRKYKACHLGRVHVPVEQRVSWLISKLTTFVTRPGRVGRLYGLASSAMLPDFEVEDLARMAADEFILELRVFEGGGVSEFLDTRGVLVPDDERDILELWEMARLGLWEVVTTDEETTLSVRDTATGETLEVTDGSMAQGFRPGEQMFARFLPGWGRTWASGVALRITPRHRASLLELLDTNPDADSIAEWYGSLSAPPSFANREDEPLVWCEARLRPTREWDELTEILDVRYEPADDAPSVWQEMLEVGPEERILRATLRRDGDELVVETNSEARLDRVLDLLSDITEVEDLTTRPVRNPSELEAALSPQQRATGGFQPPDPEVADQIADMLERRWLDEEVPALGGVTPRMAAIDPTRREDLVALLRMFDRMPETEGITMRPDVLRRHLGIEE